MQSFGLARRLFVASHVVDNPRGELSVVPIPSSKDLVLEGELLTLKELTFVSTSGPVKARDRLGFAWGWYRGGNFR